MLVVHSPLHLRHDPGTEVSFGHEIPALEVGDRAEGILAALDAARRHVIVPPTGHGLEPIEAVHDPRMLAYLERSWDAWRASGRTDPIVPDTLLLERYRDGMGEAPEPRSAAGAIGYWCFDTATPIVEGTWAAARAAADVALTAADAVLAGATAAYGLCRPPGHHAARRMFGGYCYLNNAAIAAQALAQAGAGRVGILDVDYHHGNGTQQLFWKRADVAYASLHGDLHRAYPYYSGHADEIGGGAGTGHTLNIPLPERMGDDDFLGALERALAWLDDRTGPILVVSLGIDTYELDPLGDLALTTDGYRRCGELVARSGRRLVIVQEGGYFLADLGRNVAAWLDGVESGQG